MFGHTDTGDGVEGPVANFAVVLDPDLDQISNARLGHARAGILGLRDRQRDPDDMGSVGAGGVHSESAPIRTRHRAPAYPRPARVCGPRDRIWRTEPRSAGPHRSRRVRPRPSRRTSKSSNRRGRCDRTHCRRHSGARLPQRPGAVSAGARAAGLVPPAHAAGTRRPAAGPRPRPAPPTHARQGDSPRCPWDGSGRGPWSEQRTDPRPHPSHRSRRRAQAISSGAQSSLTAPAAGRPPA